MPRRFVLGSAERLVVGGTAGHGTLYASTQEISSLRSPDVVGSIWKSWGGVQGWWLEHSAIYRAARKGVGH